jgi:hypothetical protein
VTSCGNGSRYRNSSRAAKPDEKDQHETGLCGWGERYYGGGDER